MPPERRRQRAASDSNPRRDFITAELSNFRLTQSRRIVKDTRLGQEQSQECARAGFWHQDGSPPQPLSALQSEDSMILPAFRLAVI